MISTRRNDKKAGAAEHVFAALAWFFVWEIAALLVGKDLILPGPLRVAVTLAGLIGQGSFWLSIGMTLIRILGGYLLGLLLACLLAVLTSFVRIADILLSPAIRIIRAVPVASFIILALLWVGRSRVPVLISMMMVVPVIWGNLSEAIASTDGKLLEMGRAYRFGKMKIFRF
jgi:NitT/TauT family transport system permease protein